MTISARTVVDVDTDDQAFLALLRQADQAAFESLFRRHNAAMIRFCCGVVGARHIAEEVVQDTWIAVLSRIDQFEGRGSLAGWIYTILLNKARTRAVREGRVIYFDDGGDGDTLGDAFDGRGRWRSLPELWDGLTPDRHVEGRSVLQHVEAVIETLPPAQRAVLILRGQQELDPAEVCSILGITQGNMRVLLHRARMTVRNALDRLQERA